MSALYFVAILTSENINAQILEYKNYMLQHFNCKVALRSPAHITLIPPFRLNQELETELIEQLRIFARGQKPFEVMIRNFSSFPPRVIFADVVKIGELGDIKAQIQNFFDPLSQFEVKADERPFHPHVTIANRDLHKNDYKKAWEYFRHLNYEAKFSADAVCLLRSSTAGWQTISRCAFGKPA